MTDTGFGQKIQSIQFGSNQIYALQENGTIIAWGENTDGILGTNNFVDVFVTQPEVLAGIPAGESVRSFVGPGYIILTNGRLYSFGRETPHAIEEVSIPHYREVWEYLNDYAAE